MAGAAQHLLIARMNGSSSSRRQRGFDGPADTLRAIKRWEAQGFNGFWVYGPRPTPGDARPVIGQWSRADGPEVRTAVITALGGTP